MFDLGWPELLLIMVVALVVIGPKELPNAIRTVSAIMRKVRGAAREFQDGIDEIARESGLDEIKRDIKHDIDYYDPDAALKRIAEIDGDTLELDDEPGPGTGNRIQGTATAKGAPSGAPDDGSAGEDGPARPADTGEAR